MRSRKNGRGGEGRGWVRTTMRERKNESIFRI